MHGWQFSLREVTIKKFEVELLIAQRAETETASQNKN